MSSSDPLDVGQRALLAVGTATYESEEFATLNKVPESLGAVVQTLRELNFFTVVKDPTGYHIDPTVKDLKAAVRKAITASLIAVIYYTGHGVHPERDTYYLVNKKSRFDDLNETSVPAADLLRLLTRRDKQGEVTTEQPTVLVIFDCCYSGSVGMEMLSDALRNIGNPNTWVIASAGALEYAQQGLFPEAFCEALRRPPTGPSQRYVSLDSIVQTVNDAYAGPSQQQARVFSPATGFTGVPPFFPNPLHQSGLAGLTVADQQHWLSRLRGGPEESTTGFYLTGKTGRLKAAQTLAAWLADPAPKGLAVVTGSPGTGKSTLLALVSLLAEESWRTDLLRVSRSGSLIERTAELLPPDTSLSAIHVRGLNTDQVAGVIAQALGRRSSSASALLEDLDDAPEQARRIFVVDAVDEAVSPGTLLGGLLVPVARQPNLQVLVGGRRHMLFGLKDVDLIVDLDTDKYQDPQALTEYIHQLLIASEESGVITAYTPNKAWQAENATTVAAAIAERATARAGGSESFLIGRLLALSVRSRSEAVDIGSEGWRSELPASVAEAFDQDLERLGTRAPVARALLTALAWANGPGLPWESIWAPVAQALTGDGHGVGRSRITDEDVRWFLEKAGAYVVEDLGPEGRSVYRPFHDLLAAHLRGGSKFEQEDNSTTNETLRERAEIEHRIVDALLATVPKVTTGREWKSAHPYLRTYLIQHAAVSESTAFSTLVHDADFLAIADPLTLSPLLSFTVPDLRDAARIYRRARPLIGRDPHANAAYLQEAACALSGAHIRSNSIRPIYNTQLACARQDDSIFTFVGHAGAVNAVAFGDGSEGFFLASGGDDGTVRIWDPITGAPVGQPLVGHSGPVNSIAFATVDDHLLLASGGDDGTVRIWDPITGAPVGQPLVGHSGPVNSIAFAPLEEQLLQAFRNGAESANVDDSIYSLNLEEDDSIDSESFGSELDISFLLVTGGNDGAIRLWDPTTGSTSGHLAGNPALPVTSVAFGVGPNDCGILAAGYLRGSVEVLHGGNDVFLSRAESVRSIAFGTGPDGQVMLAAGGSDGIVHIWDPATGFVLQRLTTGFWEWILSVIFVTGKDGRLLLATAGEDGTASLWDAYTGAPVGKPLAGHAGTVTSVAASTAIDDHLLLATGGSDGTVRIWDAVADISTEPPPIKHAGPVSSVAFGRGSDGNLLLATDSIDHTVRLWNPMSGDLDILNTEIYQVMSVAFGNRKDGSLLLAAGCDGGNVRLWDPVTKTSVGRPIVGDFDAAFSVALGSGSDGRLLLAAGCNDGSVHLWDPLTGKTVRESLITHSRLVWSVAFGSGSDGRLLLAAGCDDGSVHLWDPFTGETVNKLIAEPASRVRSVAFGTRPDGRLLLACSNEGRSVMVWDPFTAMPSAGLLPGHFGNVRCIAFGTGPDGQLLVASGDDHATVHLWNPINKVHLATFPRRANAESLAMANGSLAIGDEEGVFVIQLNVLPCRICRSRASTLCLASWAHFHWADHRGSACDYWELFAS